jgi:hypothetical protein
LGKCTLSNTVSICTTASKVAEELDHPINPDIAKLKYCLTDAMLKHANNLNQLALAKQSARV